MPASLLKLALSLSYITSGVLAYTITPYSDGHCLDKIQNWSWKSMKGERVRNEPWDLGNGVRDEAFSGMDGRKDYEQIRFDIPADKVDNASSGYTVYWRVPEMDRGCRAIIMKPYTESNYGSMGKNPGNVVINAGSPGCFYSSLLVDTSIMMTYCCGPGDCSAYSAGVKALQGRSLDATPDVEPNLRATLTEAESKNIEAAFTKRDMPLCTGKPKGYKAPELPKNLEDKLKAEDSSADEEPPQDLPSKRSGISITSLTARASSMVKYNRKAKSYKRGLSCGPEDDECFARAFAECKREAGNGRQVGGVQKAVSAISSCSTGGVCNINVGWSLASTNEMSVSKETSFTTNCGYDISVSAGIAFPFVATASGGISKSLAWGTSGSASQSIGTTISGQVDHTEGIRPGDKAFMTFTPSYECKDVTYTCGVQEAKFTVESCEPNKNDDGSTQGEYMLVYTD